MYELLKAILRVFMNEIIEFEYIKMKFIDRIEISRKYWCCFMVFGYASANGLIISILEFNLLGTSLVSEYLQNSFLS